MPTALQVSRRSLLIGIGSTMLLAACSKGAGSPSTELRLGYFPNVTHATAIVGDIKGHFAARLGKTKLTVSTFNAGPAAMEALKSGAIDATYVGPGPATNAFLNSGGQAIRVISGEASGGAALVVQTNINSAADLVGQKVASPQLGNTQDIALRHWLKDQGLTSDLQGGGDVSVTPTENAQLVNAFSQKLIAGAWVPEPYASALVAAGGKVLVDEASLWPGQQFPTTLLAVRPDYLEANKENIKALLQGQLDAEEAIAADASKAQADVNALIARVAGKQMDPKILASAWTKLTFTNDPLAAAIATGANNAYQVGVLTSEPKLEGLIDVTLLNEVLSAEGKQPVAS